MFSLIWFFLLFSASDTSESKSPDCDQQNNMTDTNISAATKLCAALKCSSDNTVESIAWYKCVSPKCEKLPVNFTLNTQPDIKSQVSIIDAYLKKNCSSISAQYDVCPFFSTANVRFTVFKQNPVMILNLMEGNKANLTCTVPTSCFGTKPPTFTWVWRRAGCNDTDITKSTRAFTVENVTAQTYTSTLTFSALARHHNTNVTCRVTFAGDTATEETSYLKVMINQSVCSDQVSFFAPSENTPASDSLSFTIILDKVVKDPTLFLVVFGTGVLIGMLLLSIIACFVVKCHRLLHKNRKKSRNQNEGLEMVTTEAFYKRDEDGLQDIQEDRIQDPEAAQGGAEPNKPTKENAYSDVSDTAMAPKETVYSNIDFSAMKARNPADGERVRETTETEYAEIKKGETRERRDDDGAEGEMLEGSAEKEEIKEEDEEVKQGLLAEEVVREGVPLYSSVDEILDEN